MLHETRFTLTSFGLFVQSLAEHIAKDYQSVANPLASQGTGGLFLQARNEVAANQIGFRGQTLTNAYSALTHTLPRGGTDSFATEV
jgi:hypothetical protein